MHLARALHGTLHGRQGSSADIVVVVVVVVVVPVSEWLLMAVRTVILYVLPWGSVVGN